MVKNGKLMKYLLKLKYKKVENSKEKVKAKFFLTQSTVIKLLSKLKSTWTKQGERKWKKKKKNNALKNHLQYFCW